MTSAVSIGPDVNAILKADPGTPAVGMQSNFSDDGAGVVTMEAAPAQEAPAAEELILGKFKSQADLEKAYKALESKMGQPAADPAPAATPDGSIPTMGEQAEGEPEGEAAADEGAEADDSPALDFEALGTEYATSGELSDASYARLEKAGISRDITDTYLQGFQAIQTLRGQQLYTAAGGEAAFKSIVEWGTANMPAAQQDAFNGAINTAILQGDPTAATMMIQAVKAQMGSGEPNHLNSTSGSAASAVAPFESRSDMAAAMRDPRYSRDAAYVDSVQRRLAISDFA